jgi:hypothetical protein
MTEKYYAPWIKARRDKLIDTFVAASERMGASFTPAARALPAAAARLIQ